MLLTSRKINIPTLFDTGSTYSLVDKKLATLLKQEIQPCDDIILTCTNKSKIKSEGKTKIKMQIGDRSFSEYFLIMRQLPYPCIIGSDIISKRNIIIALNEGCLWFGDKPEDKIKLDVLNNNMGKLMMATLTEKQHSSALEIMIETRIQKILQEFPTVARTDGKLGRTDVTVHIIDTVGPPQKQKPYKKSLAMREIIREQIHALEKN